MSAKMKDIHGITFTFPPEMSSNCLENILRLYLIPQTQQHVTGSSFLASINYDSEKIIIAPAFYEMQSSFNQGYCARINRQLQPRNDGETAPVLVLGKVEGFSIKQSHQHCRHFIAK